ncbi:MAG TPA: hypothetical protein VGD67_10005 [Pseudonocardiaceae bacterium]
MSVDPQPTMSAAERLLSRWCGATVRLTDPEDLGGSARSVVLRVRVGDNPFSLPRTLVLKRSLVPAGVAGEGPDTYAHEAASCQLLTAVQPADPVGPELIAHDPVARLLIMEDLGRAATLAEKLLGSDPRSAERGLLAWARSLGRLHAVTAGREADFGALMRRLGPRTWHDPIAPDARRALAELPELLAAELGVVTPPATAIRARGTARLLGGGGFRAFSPSDLCPDNNLVTNHGVRFLDFEWGCIRDVTLDVAYLRVPFPSCWCVHRLPAGMADAMLAAWRAETVDVWPALADDDVLLPRLLDAQVLWTWLSTWWLVPRGEEADRPISSSTPETPGRAAALVDRWERLAVDCASTEPALAEHATTVADALRARWSVPTPALRPYPAFRGL